MESEQHLLNLTTLELIRIIQELKDDNEKLQNELQKTKASADFWLRNYGTIEVNYLKLKSALSNIEEITEEKSLRLYAKKALED